MIRNKKSSLAKWSWLSLLGLFCLSLSVYVYFRLCKYKNIDVSSPLYLVKWIAKTLLPVICIGCHTEFSKFGSKGHRLEFSPNFSLASGELLQGVFAAGCRLSGSPAQVIFTFVVGGAEHVPLRFEPSVYIQQQRWKYTEFYEWWKIWMEKFRHRFTHIILFRS